MKKTILQILAASILWCGILCLCIRFGGEGLTLYFEQPPESSGMEVRFDPENIVRLSDSRNLPNGREIQLSFSALQQGETDVTIAWEGLDEDSLYEKEISMTIRSLPMGILTDSITWNFTGWEYLVLCLTFYFLSLSLILFLASQESIHILNIDICSFQGAQNMIQAARLIRNRHCNDRCQFRDKIAVLQDRHRFIDIIHNDPDDPETLCLSQGQSPHINPVFRQIRPVLRNQRRRAAPYQKRILRSIHEKNQMVWMVRGRADPDPCRLFTFPARAGRRHIRYFDS